MNNKKGLSLKRNFSWNFVGNLVYALGQWLVLVIIAKIGNPQMVGLYSLGLAFTAPILMLTNLQLRAVQATDTSNKFTFNHYFGLRIATGIIALFFVLVINYINNFDLNKSLIIFLVGMSKVIDSYSDVVYGQLQQRERMDFLGISRILKGIITLFTVGMTLLITKSLLVSLLVLNITWLMIFCLYDFKSLSCFLKNKKPNFNIYKFKELIILTFPLGIMLMLGSLNTNFPRIIIEKVLGESQLGFFAALAYLIIAGNTFISAVGQAAAPRLAKYYSNKQITNFVKLLSRLLFIGFGIGLLGLIATLGFGEQILSFVYDESYSKYNNIFILLMVSGTFSFTSSFLGHAMTSMRLFKIQPYMGGFWFLISIVGSLILIPLFGLVGAAVTLIISSVIQLISQAIVVFVTIKKASSNNNQLEKKLISY
jgi:O-antigen/teichoic acid export membrane protein